MSKEAKKSIESKEVEKKDKISLEVIEKDDEDADDDDVEDDDDDDVKILSEHRVLENQQEDKKIGLDKEGLGRPREKVNLIKN